MTRTAMEHAKITSNEKIAAEERALKASEGRKDREHKSSENAKDRRFKGRLEMAKAGVNILGGGLKLLKNDPAWYKNYLTNVESFVNVPTYDRLGQEGKYPFLYRGTVLAQSTQGIPGIMIFPWIPTVGPQGLLLSTVSASPVNQTLSRTKEKVLALNSRSSVNWEGSDLGYNIFCTADIMSLILELGRVIKVYNTYHASNAYLAQSLVEALGWDYLDIVAHQAEYRQVYAKMARKFNSAIVAPRAMSIYSRRAFLATNIFADSKDAKYPRQLYAYRQAGFLKLSAVGDKCEMVDVDSVAGPWDISSFEAEIQGCFARITDNPDFIEMYQDLRHAFGTDLIQLEEGVEEATISFNVDELNRLQIHNLKSLPLKIADTYVSEPTFNANGWDLNQDTNGYLFQGNTSPNDRIVSYPASWSSSQGAGLMVTSFITRYLDPDNKDMYNVFEEGANGDTILDITRWGHSGTFKYTAPGTYTYHVQSCGTEICLPFKVYNLVTGSGLMSTPISTYYLSERATLTAALKCVSAVALLSPFDWAPIVHVGQLIDEADATANIHVETYIEAHTTFLISNRDVKSLHEVCVMSELYTPDVGFKANPR